MTSARPSRASPSVTDDSLVLLPEVDKVSRCMTEVVLPTGDKPINDPPLSTGLENYKEFFQTLVGLSSEAQNFDGNGPMVRFQTGGGQQHVLDRQDHARRAGAVRQPGRHAARHASGATGEEAAVQPQEGLSHEHASEPRGEDGGRV